jgi:uncharacterized protein (DUF2461 family)
VSGEQASGFYPGLRADNSTTYWTAHKDTNQRLVRDPMRALLDHLAPVFGEPVLFRPYRDLRFSSDEAPYIADHVGPTIQRLDRWPLTSTPRS